MQERIIALDVGDKRIGIAVSDPLGITAQPVQTYTRVGYGPDVRAIEALAAQYGTRRILCGLPLNMDGTAGFQAQKVRDFAAQLEAAGFSVDYYDERMTTVLAEGALLEADMRRANRKKKVDMVAAVMILQSYLDAQAASRRADAARVEAEDADEDADEEADDGVLEMEDEDGNVVRFTRCAEITYAGDRFALLACCEAAAGFEQDESLIMRLTHDEQGVECYQTIDDEALVQAVYEAYLAQSAE